MGKYPINRDLWPLAHFIPPMNPSVVSFYQRFARPPRAFKSSRDLRIDRLSIPVQGGRIDAHLLTPQGLSAPSPCLLYFHGGGFVMPAAPYHYKLCMEYARRARVRVVMADYRLAPAHPFPIMFEDCYAALCHVYDNAQSLGIDPARIAVGGDSAGGTLAASVCLAARDRSHPVRPLFQLLLYPYLDDSGTSESHRKYIDTPVWNARLSQRVTPLFMPDSAQKSDLCAAPARAQDLSHLPEAYIETAEFDCLHDDGVLYAARLREAGVAAELHEVRGAMHGFDMLTRSATAQAMLAKRLAFIAGRMNA